MDAMVWVRKFIPKFDTRRQKWNETKLTKSKVVVHQSFSFFFFFFGISKSFFFRFSIAITLAAVTRLSNSCHATNSSSNRFHPFWFGLTTTPNMVQELATGNNENEFMRMRLRFSGTKLLCTNTIIRTNLNFQYMYVATGHLNGITPMYISYNNNNNMYIIHFIYRI